MTNFANNRHHVFVVIFGLVLGLAMYTFFSGEGSYSFILFEIHKDLLAKSFGFLAFGLYSRWCYEPSVLPNEQAIELFLGNQTGRVFEESNIVFVARPFWSIWKRLSIQHFSFTVATQNRTTEGHSVMVFATGKAVPVNVQLLAKISQEGMQEQVLGLSMMTIGAYIRENTRDALLTYQHWDISELIKSTLGENNFYGLDVLLFTTKVIEVSQETMRQFDMIARQADMQTMLLSLKQNFPNISDVELYAMYASFVGITPQVMSYVINGKGSNTILLGRGDNQ